MFDDDDDDDVDVVVEVEAWDPTRVRMEIFSRDVTVRITKYALVHSIPKA